jgi:hypothetical protein
LPLPVVGNSVHISFTSSRTMLQCLKIVLTSDYFKPNIKTIPVKSLHSSQEFAIVSATDQNLRVVLHGLCQNWEWTDLEFFLLTSIQLFSRHLGTRLCRRRHFYFKINNKTSSRISKIIPSSERNTKPI